MDKPTLKDIEVKDKRVLVRVDFNVPIDERTGAITDDNRIRAALPTIKYLIGREAKVILMSHFGRPKGKVVDKLRLGVVGEYLSQLLGQSVEVTKDCIGPEVERVVESLSNGDVLLLENLRFHPEEEEGSPSFAQALARLADIYVNDAFGVCHRAHASITGVPNYLPAVAGLLLEKEIKTLGTILENPAHPFASLLGGAKVSDKVSILENIMDKVDVVLVGGGMAATFLRAKSCKVGLSLVEEDKLGLAVRLMESAEERGVHWLLPVDVVVADEVSAEAQVKMVSIENISPQMRIVDIGSQTVANFHEALRGCKTVFWNGPMGIYEIPRFAEGTKGMAGLLASLEATTVIGGGSTAEIVTEMGLAGKMSFVSTGGGASLSFLGGEKLPGIVALPDKGSLSKVR